MRQTLILLFIFSLISCSSTKVNNNEIIVKTNFNDLKIAKTSTVINSDTINFNELRFHNIDSAYDTMKSMFLDFGSWKNVDAKTRFMASQTWLNLSFNAS